jgi:hypothetical protein
MDGTVVREVRFQLKYDRWLSPIGTFRTSREVRSCAAIGGKADLSVRDPSAPFYEYTA